MTSSHAAPPARPDILIVDDNPANLQVLSGMLNERGYKVRPVPSGKLALRAARQVAPDLVLLDVMMPEMDGFEVCEQLKAEPLLKEVPVIFVSALNETLDKVRAFRAGAVDYVTKPFQFEEVEARVQTHLKLHRLQRQLEEHNAQLDALVRVRTYQLAESNARLAVLDQAKSDFLTLISHELRTPLSGVLGIAELTFRECGDKPVAPKLREMFEMARRRIVTLLDDALLLTQIELHPDVVCREACALSEILQTALAQAASLAQTRNVSLPPAPAGTQRVSGRRDLLVRALQSLFETAVKFSREGQAVRLNVEPAGDRVQVTVEATGWSIPPQWLPRFFDVLAVRDTITPGGDLGLAPAVAERILRAYGGSLRVEDCEPPGIRLTFELQAAPPEPS